MTADPSLRSVLAGVKGLLLDLDGVIVMKGELIPGAAAALAALDAAAIPYLIATNTSLFSRATLSAEMAKGGLAIPPERILSAASACAGYCRRRFGTEPLCVMGAPDGLREFAALNLVSPADVAEGARAVAAVIGDAADEFTPANLQAVFRLIRGGAAFIAMHKNRWWWTQDGERMDAGAYVAGLEFGTERRALVTGKPARAFFGEGVRGLEEIAGRRLAAEEVAMVGDDLWNDVLGAQRAGLRGIFVRTGKHGDADLARLSSGRGAVVPEAVAASLGDVAAALAG